MKQLEELVYDKRYMNFRNKLPIISITISAISSLWIYQFFKNPVIIFQILIFFIVAFLVILRKSNLGNLIKFQLFQNIFLGSSTLFVTLLVISTGGFLSPFFILIHLTTLAFAFLFTLSYSLTFLIFAIIVSSIHIYYFFPSQSETLDPVLLVVYLLSLVTIVPITFMVARKYDFTNKLAKYLGKQLFITQTEKNLLLGNITEGVITLDQNLRIVGINHIAQRLTKIDENFTKNKEFFSIFTFIDAHDHEINKESLPLDNLLKIQASFKKESITLKTSGGLNLKINLNFSSNVDDEGKVTGILFIFNDLTKQALYSEIQNVIQKSFQKNLDFQKESLRNVEKSAVNLKATLEKSQKQISNIYDLYQFLNPDFNPEQELLDISQVLKKISQDKTNVKLLFEKPPQAEMKIGNEKKFRTLSSIYPFSTVTNLFLLQKALESLIQLATDLRSSQNDIALADAKITNDNIQVTINTTLKNLPDSQLDELFNPFFGTLGKNQFFSNSTGLEGYIAKIFIEEIGGTIVAVQNKNGLVFTVKIDYLKNK